VFPRSVHLATRFAHLAERGGAAVPVSSAA